MSHIGFLFFWSHSDEIIKLKLIFLTLEEKKTLRLFTWTIKYGFCDPTSALCTNELNPATNQL